MATQARQAAFTYANVGLQTGAMSASPHQLIVMLFDGLATALKKARWGIDGKDRPLQGRSITKAIDILERGLRGALDHERGGELSTRLDGLYEYMVRRLMLANLRNDSTLVGEVETLADNIASAWKQIG